MCSLFRATRSFDRHFETGPAGVHLTRLNSILGPILCSARLKPRRVAERSTASSPTQRKAEVGHALTRHSRAGVRSAARRPPTSCSWSLTTDEPMRRETFHGQYGALVHSDPEPAVRWTFLHLGS